MSIRIMHVVDSLAVGGLQSGLSNVIRRLDARQFEHYICAMRSPSGVRRQQFPIDPTRVISLDLAGKRGRCQVPALVRTIRRVRPNIVHSRNWGTVEAVLAARWLRSGAIIHSEHGLDTKAAAGEPWRRRYLRRIAFELADRVFSVSYHLRKIHAARTGYSANKITVIHNGVDTQRFRPDSIKRARVRRELELGDDFCIGCVGNLFPVKDQMTALKAFAAISPAESRCSLLLIGEGPELPRLKAFAAERPEWSGRVRFVGASDCVPDMLNALDVYVLPSLIEGISNSLLEAMATALPVIVTNVGGNSEVAVDGKTGYFFDAGDYKRLAAHLQLLQARTDLRSTLGRQALCRVRESFSIESMVHKYEELYSAYGPEVLSPARALAEI